MIHYGQPLLENISDTNTYMIVLIVIIIIIYLCRVQTAECFLQFSDYYTETNKPINESDYYNNYIIIIIVGPDLYCCKIVLHFYVFVDLAELFY